MVRGFAAGVGGEGAAATVGVTSSAVVEVLGLLGVACGAVVVTGVVPWWRLARLVQGVASGVVEAGSSQHEPSVAPSPSPPPSLSLQEDSNSDDVRLPRRRPP